jgi:hypothetical protein
LAGVLRGAKVQVIGSAVLGLGCAFGSFRPISAVVEILERFRSTLSATGG